MTATPSFAHRLRVAHLNPRAPNPLDLEPDAAARAAIAAELDLLDLPALRFKGEVVARGNDAWVLTCRLTARVVQPCVVTMAPVESPIDEEVRRIFSPHMTAPTEEEIEMPDDEMEPLGQFIDAGAVMIEALALALPLYPRADGAELPEAEDESEAGDEDDRKKPFAGLGDLLKKRPQ
ncbi:YceD family protein [Paracoccus zhejiangensis]|uniref:DUF177 domain-containing protein n=1 Tax=Paracoccus zhejiangensis TaxID=1077935 RepID=A0A2H5EUK4_9RHOB|nr:DUF177 domain-containing protein [Paracoccus zhejiangensis]AUH62970.1 hypothetical protein CX676_01335 [Paracoccus zhejiangensis]